MKILILGSTGMLGHVLSDYMSKSNKYNVYNLSRKKISQDNHLHCDVKDLDLLKRILLDTSPSVVINCIGVLNEEAEKNTSNAEYINSFLPNYLLSIAKKNKFKLIQISTDCVFSGNDGNYNEYSKKDAKDVYGQTKSKGEFDIQDHLTIRTSIIGPDIDNKGKGLFQWIMKQKGEVKGFSNVKWTGVTSLELSKAIDFSISNSIDGLWNLTNQKIISKYDLISLIIKEFDISSVNLKEYSKKISNKSLISVRNINYKVPDYSIMIKELNNYYILNKNIYI